MEYTQAIIAASILIYALVSGRLSRSAISGTLVFATVGLLVGPEVLDIVDLNGLIGEEDFIALLITMTLVIVLFTDACAINSAKWRDDVIPARLLGVGFPLTVVAGAATGLLVLTDLAIWEAAVLATMLAPTDAALGKAVVSNERVPTRIRQALNIESGLNDGVALPLFVVFLETAKVAEGELPAGELVVELLLQVGIAVAVGTLVGYTGMSALRWAIAHEMVEGQWAQIAVVGMAALAYTLATPPGGSGFIAAWVAGFVFGRLSGDQLRSEGRSVVSVGRELHTFSETVGDLLTMLSFLVFGLLLGPTLPDLNWTTVLYAVLSLTVLRIVPVWLSQIGSHLSRGSLLYLGWFGPRGLATLLLALAVAGESDLSGADTIVDVALFTVGLSVLLHGVTAWWGSNAYADYVEGHPDGEAMPEHHEAPEVRVSRRISS